MRSTAKRRARIWTAITISGAIVAASEASSKEKRPPDPRVGLAAGYLDAGQAALHMKLVATRPRAPGFADRSVSKSGQAAAERFGFLDFANSDLAFAGDRLFEGSFHGLNAYDIREPLAPELLFSIVCPGGQGDVSVLGDLLFVSVEETRSRVDCGAQGVETAASRERFRGIRIFDVSDAERPRQVAAVQTCRGSHTHTLVTDPDDEGNIYLYSSGTAPVRPGEELEGCSDRPPEADPDTALFSIDVVQVPLAHPERAAVVSRPRVFADPRTGSIAGLWRGGNHGPGTQTTAETSQCHDITVFAELGLAAGACAGNGILLDVSDPMHPVRLDQVSDPNFAYWHSATFNNDGTKVVFTDEWGGGARPHCRASDPTEWGADAIFDIVDRKLQFRGYFKMPAEQTDTENCVAHNGSLVPVPGRDIMVQAWYQGGISVFDFTDSAHPVEIAFFDRGPLDANRLVIAGQWSAYWYDGYVYGSEIARGLDVLELLPSEHLSRNEIDAARLVVPSVLNVQQQRRVDWPAQPVVAHAYLDQLGRTGGISSERAAALRKALESLDGRRGRGAADDDAAARLARLAQELERDGAASSGIDAARLRSLATTVRELAAQPR